MTASLVLLPPQTSGSSGGGGTIGGSIAANQVAVGSGVNTISGSANLQWNGSTLTVNGAIYGTGALVLSKTTSTAVSYSMAATDLFLRVIPVPPAAITITLPAVATASTGQIYVIKDGNGFAGVGTELTISAQAGETIDGSLTQVFNTPWVSIMVRNTGSTWDII